MSFSQVGCRLRGNMDPLSRVPSVPDRAQYHVGPLSCAQWPWWMISLPNCCISLAHLVLWCLGVWKWRFCCFSAWGGWVEDRSWEVSSSPIVKVLWKSEPEVMAEEVLVRGAWMLTALPLVTCLLALIQGVVFCLFVFSRWHLIRNHSPWVHGILSSFSSNI